jgi:Protein of unknown function (DUF1573)
VVHATLGLVLLLAAAFKVHAFWAGSNAAISLFSSPRWQVALIELETLLGLWLLTGLYPWSAWLAATAGFSLLASISLYLGLLGQPSCGCFGRVAVNPWSTFALDVAAVAALWHWRPQPLPWPTRLGGFSMHCLRPPLHLAPGLRGLLQSASGAVAILALIAGMLLLAIDDPAGALARLRGEFISVEPGVSEVGDGVAGEQRTFTIHLANHGERPVRIVGGTTTCACIATNDLPITVPPGASKAMEVQVTFRGVIGRFQHSFTLYTDDEQHSVVRARFAGRVAEPASP